MKYILTKRSEPLSGSFARRSSNLQRPAFFEGETPSLPAAGSSSREHSAILVIIQILILVIIQILRTSYRNTEEALKIEQYYIKDLDLRDRTESEEYQEAWNRYKHGLEKRFLLEEKLRQVLVLYQKISKQAGTLAYETNHNGEKLKP